MLTVSLIDDDGLDCSMINVIIDKLIAIGTETPSKSPEGSWSLTSSTGRRASSIRIVFRFSFVDKN
jgi:hypothetical protein